MLVTHPILIKCLTYIQTYNVIIDEITGITQIIAVSISNNANLSGILLLVKESYPKLIIFIVETEDSPTVLINNAWINLLVLTSCCSH